jgi:hypothetical protein
MPGAETRPDYGGLSHPNVVQVSADAGLCPAARRPAGCLPGFPPTATRRRNELCDIGRPPNTRQASAARLRWDSRGLI